MTDSWFKVQARESGRGLDVVRVLACLILAAHPVHGIWSGGSWGQDVAGFGQYLGSTGLPFGLGLAWAIILLQLLGVAAILARRWVAPACAVLIAILAAGILMIHRQAGWFVVGGGRNGMEFSVLLCGCFAAVLWAHWPRTKNRR